MSGGRAAVAVGWAAAAMIEGPHAAWFRGSAAMVWYYVVVVIEKLWGGFEIEARLFSNKDQRSDKV